MGIWMEMRCSRQKPGCRSGRNEGPMTLVADSHERVIVGLRQLETEARRDGWRRTLQGWVCPECSSSR